MGKIGLEDELEEDEVSGNRVNERYADVDNGETEMIYDQENPTAWIESDLAFEYEDII